jgi:regulator of extracellular matrix RemA (YlzA/DUF370 family)
MNYSAAFLHRTQNKKDFQADYWFYIVSIASPRLLHIGYDNFVDPEKIVTVLKPGGSPVKRLRQRALETDRLVDATAGNKTRSVIIMSTNHSIYWKDSTIWIVVD